MCRSGHFGRTNVINIIVGTTKNFEVAEHCQTLFLAVEPSHLLKSSNIYISMLGNLNETISKFQFLEMRHQFPSKICVLLDPEKLFDKIELRNFACS